MIPAANSAVSRPTAMRSAARGSRSAMKERNTLACVDGAEAGDVGRETTSQARIEKDCAWKHRVRTAGSLHRVAGDAVDGCVLEACVCRRNGQHRESRLERYGLGRPDSRSTTEAQQAVGAHGQGSAGRGQCRWQGHVTANVAERPGDAIGGAVEDVGSRLLLAGAAHHEHALGTQAVELGGQLCLGDAFAEHHARPAQSENEACRRFWCRELLGGHVLARYGSAHALMMRAARLAWLRPTRRWSAPSSDTKLRG